VTTPQEARDWTPRPDPTLLTTQQLLRELSSLREIFETRLNGMDRAAEVLAATVNRTPTAIQMAVTGMREVYDERFASMARLSDERLKSIALQFAERDVRSEQAATAGASALAAALQAAKEAVFEQALAAGKAAEKTELSFTKQIDQIQLQIKTIGDGFSDRIGELKERIDRGEGADAGSSGQRTESRLNTGTLLTFGLFAVTLATFIIVYVAKR
jgi:hypothetical protein